MSHSIQRSVPNMWKALGIVDSIMARQILGGIRQELDAIFCGKFIPGVMVANIRQMPSP